jgi:hypothetical protein
MAFICLLTMLAKVKQQHRVFNTFLKSGWPHFLEIEAEEGDPRASRAVVCPSRGRGDEP